LFLGHSRLPAVFAIAVQGFRGTTDGLAGIGREEGEVSAQGGYYILDLSCYFIGDRSIERTKGYMAFDIMNF
jgi:hypothetical protein